MSQNLAQNIQMACDLKKFGVENNLYVDAQHIAHDIFQCEIFTER